jgi:MFS family permease
MTGTLSMILLDSTVVSVALPSIKADLDMGETELQWVVNAYLLALAVFSSRGRADLGHVQGVGVLISGVALFVTASAFGGLARSRGSGQR